MNEPTSVGVLWRDGEATPVLAITWIAGHNPIALVEGGMVRLRKGEVVTRRSRKGVEQVVAEGV
jgi:hypothetical protein